MALTYSKAQKKQEAKLPSGNLLETAIGVVTVAHADGSKEETTEEMMVHGKGPFANIGVRAKVTINLGNYENVQVEVSLFVPSVATPDAILESFNYASNWIDARMNEMSEKYTPKKQ